MKEKEKEKETTTVYSGDFLGDRKNHNWHASFDFTEGYVGISQRQDESLQRVLLTPGQFEKLVQWVKGAQNK